MYDKNLIKYMSLRLCQEDYDFLIDLASRYSISVSSLMRLVIHDYRRYLFDKVIYPESLFVADLYGPK